MSDIIEKNVNSAKELDLHIRKAVLGTVDLDNSCFVQIDTEYPTTVEDENVIPDKATVAAQHQGFIDRISKLQLTNSLFLGLGMEPPDSYALSLDAAKKITEGYPDSIVINEDFYQEDGKSFHAFIVKHPAAEYTFLESDLWLGYLRALHFFTTRHDPDLVESINRKLSNFSGLSDPSWLDAAKAN